MLDLETLGNRPGAIIASIGAVKFGGGIIHDQFYARIDVRSAERAGLCCDADTVLWWMGKDDAARQELRKGGRDIHDVLQELAEWAGVDAAVWGNSATFDNVLLADAYRVCGMEPFWHHSGDRCYRTIRNTIPGIAPLYPTFLTGETPHNALDDARAQARHLMEMLPNL